MCNHPASPHSGSEGSEVQLEFTQCPTCGAFFRPRRRSHRFCSVHCVRKFFRPDPIARFWNHVEKADGCWNWTASVNTNGGYGQLLWNGRMAVSHRVSWELAYGPIPAGLQVLHTCDNRRCVNPAHLRLGTQADNIRDMWDKGRATYQTRPAIVGVEGEAHPNAKLTEKDVLEIRKRVAAGEQHLAVARSYHVNPSTVWKIVRRLAWTHI